MATLRNLKIKTSTCKRIAKELQCYEKEVERETAKTAEMKEKSADPYDLKQQENVLAESRMMVPDCHKRLETALTDLKSTLDEIKESNEQGPEIEEAETVIAQVEANSADSPSSSPPASPRSDPNTSVPLASDASATPNDANVDALARQVQESLSMSRRHTFWETQPVGQFNQLGDTTLPEGPIEPPTPLSEVKQEPYKLPPMYEWSTCDMEDGATCAEVYALLAHNYVEDDENMFRFNYSANFLRWALRPPAFYRSWHIGVRVKSSKKLVAFITGIPARIRVKEEIVKMAEINFLCVHKKLRSKRLAPVMIKEVTRRVHMENVWQAAYTAGIVLPTPVTTCRYWHRSLNPKKLIDVGFSRLGPRMTMSRTMRLYRLPGSTLTPGFRKMELRDVPAVTRLLRGYLGNFDVAPDFDEADVEHWLLPREDVVDSFLVESPETHEITDFCSFYSLPSSILNNQNYSVLKAAYSYYNVTTKTPLGQLINDALIVAKQKGFDVFNALDVMENEVFLKDMKFGPGDGQLHYYLYNYRVRNPLKPSELGLVLL